MIVTTGMLTDGKTSFGIDTMAPTPRNMITIERTYKETRNFSAYLTRPMAAPCCRPTRSGNSFGQIAAHSARRCQPARALGGNALYAMETRLRVPAQRSTFAVGNSIGVLRTPRNPE